MDIFKILSGSCETKQNVNLKEYCTIRIGGVGKIACFPKNVYEIGTTISKEYWGRGVATSTLKATINYLFKEVY